MNEAFLTAYIEHLEEAGIPFLLSNWVDYFEAYCAIPCVALFA